ncbi:glutamic acid-rich protein-like [Impatiens glandulifera]|uniref:glutamic acid-rich protein-like n=1 Tax=Impatiens glandulifera TaxID=253017 RepID=UPI001FB11CFC|nr:glutamic acid-rich protein-like [Impatiens glandulifera]
MKKNWNKKGICDVAYILHGFALAFQVWTYELIDTFVPNFAEKTLEDDLTSPMIVLCKSFRSYTGPEVSTAIQECTVRRKIHEFAEEKRMKRKIEVFEEEEKHERTPKPPTKKSRHISPKVREVSDETSQESSSHSIPSATTPIPTEDKSTSCAPNRVSQDLTAKLDVLTNVVNVIKSEIKLMKENQQLIITLLGQRNEQKNGGGEEKEEAGTAAIDTEKRTTKRKNNDLTLVENRTKRKNDDVDNENGTKRKNDELMNSKRKNDEKMKKIKEDDDEITRKRKERRERLAILSKKRIADELDKKRNADKLAKKRKAEKRKSKKNDEEEEDEYEETKEEETLEKDEETEEEDEETEENDEKTEENDKNDDVHENKEVVENKEKEENMEVEENKEKEVEVEENKEVEKNKEKEVEVEENKEEEDLPHVPKEKKEEVEKEIVKEVIVETEEEKKKKEKNKQKEKEVKQLTPSQFVGKSFRRKKKSKQLGEYTDPGGKWFKLNDPVKVNPLLRIDEEKMKELKKWLKSDAKDFKELTVCSADRSLFNRLLKPQQWLHDTKMNNRYDMFTPNPAGYEFDDLMEYVFGEGSNHWNIVDMIYVPLNLK